MRRTRNAVYTLRVTGVRIPPSPPVIRLFLYLISNIVFEDLPHFGVSEGVRGNFKGNFVTSESNSYYDIS